MMVKIFFLLVELPLLGVRAFACKTPRDLLWFCSLDAHILGVHLCVRNVNYRISSPLRETSPRIIFIKNLGQLNIFSTSSSVDSKYHSHVFNAQCSPTPKPSRASPTHRARKMGHPGKAQGWPYSCKKNSPSFGPAFHTPAVLRFS